MVCIVGLHLCVCSHVYHCYFQGADPLIYEDIQNLLAKKEDGAAGMATKLWKQINQLRTQKAELLRETTSIVGHLGRIGALVGYVSIGDNGKMVQLFRKHGLVRGRSWVVHGESPRLAPLCSSVAFHTR